MGAGSGGSCCAVGKQSAGRNARSCKPSSPRIIACSRAYVLREQLDKLWTYKTRTGVLNFLLGWFKALRWQRLPEMEKLGEFLLRHLDGIAAYCDHPVRFGVVESLNTTIKAIIRRARGMRDEALLLL